MAERREPLIAPGLMPLVVDEHGDAWVPDAFVDGAVVCTPLGEGVALGWWPSDDGASAFLAIFAGAMKPAGTLVAVHISHAGLRGLIADLQSIDAQLGPTT